MTQPDAPIAAAGPHGARGAVIVAAAGLGLFLVFVATVHGLGWLRFKLGPVAVVFGGMIVLNLGLAARPERWARGPWVAWVYEGVHAVLLTVVLHYFGGLSMGVYLLVYGFLVIHTEVLRPGASVFVTANVCSLCYAALAAIEGGGWIAPEHVIRARLRPGEQIVFVSFGFLALNFLALYGHRHGQALRGLAWRLQEMVTERTAALTAANHDLAVKAHALERKQEEFKDFVYTVTHDLKTPMTAVLLTTDLLRERESAALTAEGWEDLSRIRQAAERAERMIASLLALFEVTSASEPAGWVDLGTVVARALEPLRPQTSAKGVQIRVAPLPRVWGKEEKLTHVIGNLLSNAVKWVPAGCGQIEVTGTPTSGSVVLCVRDNGVGIPEAYQTGIFNMFGRVPRSAQRVNGSEQAGTGVGLAIVKRIVEAHGGAVWVESGRGAGSCFYVRLPARAQP